MTSLTELQIIHQVYATHCKFNYETIVSLRYDFTNAYQTYFNAEN